jgi:hypothetical protein
MPTALARTQCRQRQRKPAAYSIIAIPLPTASWQTHCLLHHRKAAAYSVIANPEWGEATQAHAARRTPKHTRPQGHRQPPGPTGTASRRAQPVIASQVAQPVITSRFFGGMAIQHPPRAQRLLFLTFSSASRKFTARWRRSLRIDPGDRTRQRPKVFCFFSSEKKTFPS